ncbi:HMG box domain-containing protein [Mycena kentingensis (nom. inval.)]|nr:HMG box domain-containing protein [Mycena kentingensis (nom. inval.)]
MSPPQRNSRRSSKRKASVSIKLEPDVSEPNLSLAATSDVDVKPSTIALSAPRPKKPSHPGHIPRPPNQFICYRSYWWEQNKKSEDPAQIVTDHRLVSKMAAEDWRKLSAEERDPFARLAQIAKQDHAQMYPMYAYKPSGQVLSSGPGASKKGKGASKRRRSTKAEDDDDYDEWVPSSRSSKRRKVRRPRDDDGSSVASEHEDLVASAPTPPPALLPVEDAPTPELSRDTPTSSETSEAHSITFTLEEQGSDLDGIYELEDDEFVLTSDIPPLDLDEGAAATKKEPRDEAQIGSTAAVSAPASLQFASVSPQFFKSDVPVEARDSLLWTSNLQLGDASYLDNELLDPNPDIHFTNPFLNADVFHSEFDEDL